MSRKNWNIPSLTAREALDITGRGFSVKLNWEGALSEQVRDWIDILSGSVNTATEYVLFSTIPAISAIVSPRTKVRVDGMGWYEPVNTGSIILGPSGAGKSSAYALTIK